MNADAWDALNRLLDQALDLSPDARASWVDSLGPEHDAVRGRLRQLLAVSPAVEVAFTLPRFDQGDDLVGDVGGAALQEGSAVGPYRLIRRLALGGMGTVWLAERADGLITRPAAVKLPRGVWQRADILERTAREREILSRLDHPNIGRLYDAGVTEQGQPYLALEYVEGQAIDRYCAERRLDVRARLRLFDQVLAAVAHAHARLVVHRDLKPPNIFVTGDGRVKVLDFGIAKLLTEGQAGGTELTQVSGRPLTPEYASPEQLAGEALTIASDIYSLGIVLYELLTGRRPFDRDARPAALPAASEAEAVLPSAAAAATGAVATHAAEIRGDLDTIVLKALKPAPGERYATVDAFADDIGRWLHGLPIHARPDSTWYRLSKFARRNTAAIAAAAAVLLAVLGGAGAAVWQARVALEEQRRAEEVKEFITSIFEGANPFAAAGEKLTAVDLLTRARSRIDAIDNASPELRIELLTLVGSSLADLTEMTDAEAILRDTVNEATRALGPDHLLTLDAHTVLALTHRFIGSRDEAGAELDELLPRLRRNPEAAEQLVEALESHAGLAMELGRWNVAEASSLEMLDVALSRFGERHPLSLSARWSLVQSYLLGGKNAEAATHADIVFPLTMEAHRVEPRAPEVIEARELYGRVLTGVGRLDEGITHIAEAVEAAAEVFGADSVLIGYYAANLASRQLEVGDLDGALKSIDRGLAVSVVIPGPTSGLHAFSHHVRGQILLAARKGDAALAQMDVALEKLMTSGERSSQSLSAAQSERALALAYTGQIDRALAALADTAGTESASERILGVVQRLSSRHVDALASQRRALSSITPGPGAARARLLVTTEMGIDYLEMGDLQSAGTTLNEALALSRTVPHPPGPEYADLLIALARVRLAQNQPADALPLAQEAESFWRRFDSGSRWSGEASLWLGRTYASLGRDAEAAPLLSRARTILSRSRIPSDVSLARLAAR